MLAMVLTVTLAVNTPALAQYEQTFAINGKGVLSMGGDIVLGKCSDLLQHRNEVRDLVKLGALRACEKAGYTASLSKTGGLPVILVPITLLIVGGLLIRKTTAP